MGPRVVWRDIVRATLELARLASDGRGAYLRGVACALPFPVASFVKVMPITTSCFLRDWPRATDKIARVTRQRFAIGRLNRHCLHDVHMGHDGGRGVYAGEGWDTRARLKDSMRELPNMACTASSGLFDASAGRSARPLEPVLPSSCSSGGFLLLSGRPARGAPAVA